MSTLQSHLVGEDPRSAVAVVAAVVLAIAAVLVPLGLLEVSGSATVSEVGFAVAFTVIPLAGGVVCGLGRLGYPAAVGCGVAPGATFAVVVAVGAALDVGSFGGGDSPLVPFAAVLTLPGVAAATAGFGVGVGAAVAVYGD